MRIMLWIGTALLLGCLPHEPDDGIDEVFGEAPAVSPPRFEVADGKARLTGRWSFELGNAVAGRVVAVFDAADPPATVRLRAREVGGVPVDAELPVVLVEVTRPEKAGTRVAEMALVAWAEPQPRILWSRTSRVVRPDGGGAIVTELAFEPGEGERPQLVLSSQAMPGKDDPPFAAPPQREVYHWNGEVYVRPPGS